jgi:hypothetical protein
MTKNEKEEAEEEKTKDTFLCILTGDSESGLPDGMYICIPKILILVYLRILEGL